MSKELQVEGMSIEGALEAERGRGWLFMHMHKWEVGPFLGVSIPGSFHIILCRQSSAHTVNYICFKGRPCARAGEKREPSGHSGIIWKNLTVASAPFVMSIILHPQSPETSTKLSPQREKQSFHTIIFNINLNRINLYIIYVILLFYLTSVLYWILISCQCTVSPL